MKRRGSMWLVLGLALVVGCGDGYTSGDPLVIGENNQMGEPAGSAEVLVGAPSGPLLEGGAAVTVSVSLKRPPTALVTIALSSSNEAAGTVSPASLTFEPGGFATAQLVTLTPVDDEVATGDKKWELLFELASDDAEFNAKPVTSLKLTTVDNDAAPSLITMVVDGAPQTTEQGGAATISVQLSRQPKSDVLIPVSVSDAAEADLDVQSLTFTTLNWNLPQRVVATGKDDKTKDGDKPYTISFGPANSADEEFNGIGPAEVALISIDGVCGNEVVDGAEQCEPDGVSECEFGQMNCMVCNNSCELVPGDVTGFCGDGITQGAQGEECDEPFGPCAYGQMSCTVCDAQCKRVPGQPSGFCGDGQVQASDEGCDEPEAACPYGQMSCMTCRACQRIPGQVTGFCGDGRIQAAQGEECDPMSAQPATCPAGSAGDTTCRADSCKFTVPCSKAASTGSGHLHGCAVFESGALRCWGQVPGRSSGAAPALVAGVTTAKQVVGGRLHTCFLLANETVRCVGANLDGQLGDGTTTDRSSPVTVAGLSSVKQIAAGDYFNCALLNNNTVKCWGNGYSGQLGQGVFNASSSPVTVSGLSNVVSIAAGEEHACAVLSSGAVRCWGSNSDSALGNSGAAIITATPVAVSGLSNASAVAIGATHSCAVLTTGGVSCWGNNADGQLGDGTTSNRATPVTVAGLTGVTQLALTASSTCALLTSGVVTCWGDNFYGQLGDGGTTSRRMPGAQVAQVSGVIHLSAGHDHTCSVTSSGVTKCWGKNSFAQTGTGASSTRQTPAATLSF